MRTDFVSEFKNCLKGRSCKVIRSTEGQWQLDFGEGNVLQPVWAWRIVGPKRIELTKEDDGQMFGLKLPVDAEVRANELLGGAKVSAVQIHDFTSDLNIQFDNGMRFEVFPMSAGYEGWSAFYSFKSKRWQIVVLGGGEFAVVQDG